MNTIEIEKRISSLIPADLMKKYTHLSFAQLAEIDELKQWRDELLKAEKMWFKASGLPF